uniref:KH_dom_type_1 domain-containing protein n=1 Tax=Strongyloides papillosus TaxID=174720 RepID=A0A0N5C5F8_STREA
MELIEPRAMGWRLNLAHTQYYLHHQNKKMATSVIGAPASFNTIPVSAIYIIPATNAIPSWGTAIQSQSTHQSTNDPETAAWTTRNNLFNNCNMSKVFPNDGLFPVVHMRQKSTNKVLQIREKITIRIAVVEDLTKTILSFQKVDSKSKDRILIITGTSHDSIEYAKKLIEETIRRNVSPSHE